MTTAYFSVITMIHACMDQAHTTASLNKCALNCNPEITTFTTAATVALPAQATTLMIDTTSRSASIKQVVRKCLTVRLKQWMFQHAFSSLNTPWHRPSPQLAAVAALFLLAAAPERALPRLPGPEKAGGRGAGGGRGGRGAQCSKPLALLGPEKAGGRGGGEGSGGRGGAQCSKPRALPGLPGPEKGREFELSTFSQSKATSEEVVGAHGAYSATPKACMHDKAVQGGGSSVAQS